MFFFLFFRQIRLKFIMQLTKGIGDLSQVLCFVVVEWSQSCFFWFLVRVIKNSTIDRKNADLLWSIDRVYEITVVPWKSRLENGHTGTHADFDDFCTELDDLMSLPGEIVSTIVPSTTILSAPSFFFVIELQLCPKIVKHNKMQADLVTI